MKIIDAKTDFYDYYQGIYKDDTITFDRRDSYILKKPDIARIFTRRNKAYASKYVRNLSDDHYLVLQICNTFWVFLLTPTAFTDTTPDEYCTDYKLSLIDKWKEYSKPRKLIDFYEITFGYSALMRLEKATTLEDKQKMFIRDYVKFDTKEHKTIPERALLKNQVDGIPILKDTGITSCVDALDIYLAFEEYFSMEKASIEQRESSGLTDVDKAENHGFDKKTSFRGK